MILKPQKYFDLKQPIADAGINVDDNVIDSCRNARVIKAIKSVFVSVQIGNQEIKITASKFIESSCNLLVQLSVYPIL